MPTGRKSEAVRQRVQLLLAAGRTHKRAAASARVSRRTVGLWSADPAFAARVRQYSGELFERAAAVLAGAHGKAAMRLWSPDAPDGSAPELAEAEEALLRAYREADRSLGQEDGYTCPVCQGWHSNK